MPEAAALSARSDAILVLAAVLELRAMVAGAEAADERKKKQEDASAPRGADEDDDLLDTHAASARFGYPRDTIAKWCREEELGRRQGGRWLVDPKKLRQRINGGG